MRSKAIKIRRRNGAAAIGIIGGADGPTAIYVAHKVNPLVSAFAFGALLGIALSFFAVIGLHKKKKFER